MAIPFAAILAWAPLPFGSVTPSMSTLLQLLLFVALALYLLIAPTAVAPAIRRGAAALAAIALLGVVQLLPLGASDPPHAGGGEQAVEAAARSGPRQPLSAAPGMTRAAIGDWLAPAAALLLGGLAGARRRSRRLLLATLVGVGLFEVAFGAQQWFARSSSIWGIEIPGGGGRLRGTFVNPNHLATYLSILAALAAAWVWRSARVAGREESLDRKLRIVGFPVLVLIALVTGLAFTGSRGGLLAVVTAGLAQLGLIFGRSRRRRLAAVLTAAWIAALASVALFGFDEGFGRLLRTTSDDGSVEGRAELAARSLRLWWTDAPWLGVGLGAFRAVSPSIQDERTGSGVLWHAHNDWVELLATAGVVGLLLLVAGLVPVLRGLTKAWRRGARSEDRAAALAAVGALVAVGLHELVEFGLTLPANAVTLAAVCGAALAVPLVERRKADDADVADVADDADELAH